MFPIDEYTATAHIAYRQEQLRQSYLDRRYARLAKPGRSRRRRGSH